MTMIIKNIVLKDLYKVLKSLPHGTRKIDIEYIDSDEETKIVIYPSGSDSQGKVSESDSSSPDIDIDEDLIDYL